MKEIKQINIFGLQRSGTNYLKAILELNFKDIKVEYDWRHSIFEDLNEESKKGIGIVIYKELGHWLKSIERKKVNIYTFVPTHANLPAYYDRWLKSYAGKDGIYFISYESFLIDFEATLKYLGVLIGEKPWRFLEPEIVKYSEEWNPEDKSKYLKHD